MQFSRAVSQALTVTSAHGASRATEALARGRWALRRACSSRSAAATGRAVSSSGLGGEARLGRHGLSPPVARGRRRARRSWLAEQVHDEAGDGELRTDDRDGLNPQGAVRARFESGDGGGEVGFRRQLLAVGAGRIAHHRHGGFRLALVEAGIAKAFRGGEVSKVAAFMALSGLRLEFLCPR